MKAKQQTTLVFFGKRLRRARERAGLTQEKLGKAVYLAPSTISMIENGQIAPHADIVEKCDSALNADGELTDIYQDLITVSLSLEWFREWVEYEQQATALKTYQPSLVPGLLQTADYMSVVLRSVINNGGDVNEHVSSRLARQDIFQSENAPMFVAILDEGVLRRPIGGPDVMHGQLMYLAEMAQHPTVTVLIVPSGAGMYWGLNGPFVIAEFEKDADVVYLDTSLRGQIVERKEDVDIIKRGWEALRSEALPRNQSLELIEKVVKTWT